ncbi:alpha/beta-hydrolase [Epithele typhae]|uniref:alpha/beta-hydrolase n=1 Tax=Epithele typhae TaxID=378194 RepID=UPI0020082273|nr:alpha/beta-hydrolase [Epithele typhae]KAH9923149.1 alpha/beta-hydrolase [Epithele typhae]
MSTQLAGACGDCCVKTVHHVGEARGSAVEIAGVRTYAVTPAAFGHKLEGHGKGVILYFSDIFNAFYINAQLTMDYFAENGYTVLGIDYLNGESALDVFGVPGKDWKAWVEPHVKRAPEVTKPWLEQVRKRYGACRLVTCSRGRILIRLGGAGNCFGAPFVMNVLAQDWAIAGAFAHPTYLTEDDFKRVRRPLLMLVPGPHWRPSADGDFLFPPESRRRAVDILIEGKMEYSLVLYGGLEHGFATRGDPNVPNQRWGKEHAALSAVAWFDHHGSVNSA